MDGRTSNLSVKILNKLKMPEEEETIPEIVITTTYEATANSLTVLATPETPLPVSRIYDISEISKKVADCDKAIAQWQTKRAIHQAVLDKHGEHYVAPIEEEGGGAGGEI